MEVHLLLVLIAFLARINCLENEHPLLQNISRLHADMDYIRTNFDRSLRLLESIVQSQTAFNASLARLEHRHDSLNASLNDLGQSVSAMKQSNDESFARVEQSLCYISSDKAIIDGECFADCLDYRNRGYCHSPSRIITTRSQDGVCNQESYCDMETDGGGWTVLQRHQSDAVNFTRGWADYKNGFGDLSDSFWWGNDKLAQVLNDGRQYELRIDLFDWEGEHRYAKYSDFHVAPESGNYRLNISGYTGNANGDAFGSLQNSQMFTTVDRDNDAYSGNCAAIRGGGGFWYRRCSGFLPNGRFSHTSSVPSWSGLHWLVWHERTYSLKAVSMMYRATN